ncbi:MAG: alpha/beta fold hydrolase [Betaproteobacteria bacterium]|nr:alpha/beta fold hydrolase [Betaproteobacteria bacterium]
MRFGALLLFSVAFAAEPKVATKRPSASDTKAAALKLAIEVRSSKDGSIQKVAYWRPESAAHDIKGASVPLIVFLHSWSGGFEQGPPWIAQAKKMGWVLVAPDFRGPNSRPEACASDLASQDILDAVEFARHDARVDNSRIYLVGGSGGGHMALVMAERAPDLWAGVSAWVPISDLAAWHAESSVRKNSYAKMLEKSCGGPPSPATEVEYRHRSPLFALTAAKGVPLDINTGIHDGHTGSVPVSHSLRAFNVLAAPDKQISPEDIDFMVREQKIPSSLALEQQNDPERQKAVLFRRSSGNARVTVFEGGHESESTSAMLWLSRQRKSQPADFSLGQSKATDGGAQTVSK